MHIFRHNCALMHGFSRVMLAILVAVSISTVAHGATITWGAPTTISGDTDVSTDGVLDRAFNFGSTSAPAPTVTINGVPFTFFGVNSASSTTVGTTTLAADAGGVNGAAELGSSSPPFSNLSANYQTLLLNGAFATPGNTLTLTLGGLVVGQMYEFEWWANDSRGAVGPDRQGTATAGNSVQLEYNSQNSEGGVGQFSIGTFTADATTEVITLTGQTSGNISSSAQINAMQLRAIPEPSASALIFIGATLSIFQLRRFRSNRAR